MPPQECNARARTSRRDRPRLLVLGIGNIVMSDDGVGVHAVRALKKRPHAGVLVTEVGTAILDALPLLGWADRVVVLDAFQGGCQPGTVYLTDLNSARSQAHQSLHDIDLATALALMPESAQRPEVLVVGVEPAQLQLGLDLSPSVQRAIPEVVALVNEKLAIWRGESSMRGLKRRESLNGNQP